MLKSSLLLAAGALAGIVSANDVVTITAYATITRTAATVSTVSTLVYEEGRETTTWTVQPGETIAPSSHAVRSGVETHDGTETFWFTEGTKTFSYAAGPQQTGLAQPPSPTVITATVTSLATHSQPYTVITVTDGTETYATATGGGVYFEQFTTVSTITVLPSPTPTFDGRIETNAGTETFWYSVPPHATRAPFDSGIGQPGPQTIVQTLTTSSYIENPARYETYVDGTNTHVQGVGGGGAWSQVMSFITLTVTPSAVPTTPIATYAPPGRPTTSINQGVLTVHETYYPGEIPGTPLPHPTLATVRTFINGNTVSFWTQYPETSLGTPIPTTVPYTTTYTYAQPGRPTTVTNQGVKTVHETYFPGEFPGTIISRPTAATIRTFIDGATTSFWMQYPETTVSTKTIPSTSTFTYAVPGRPTTLTNQGIATVHETYYPGETPGSILPHPTAATIRTFVDGNTVSFWTQFPETVFTGTPSTTIFTTPIPSPSPITRTTWIGTTTVVFVEYPPTDTRLGTVTKTLTDGGVLVTPRPSSTLVLTDGGKTSTITLHGGETGGVTPTPAPTCAGTCQTCGVPLTVVTGTTILRQEGRSIPTPYAKPTGFPAASLKAAHTAADGGPTLLEWVQEGLTTLPVPCPITSGTDTVTWVVTTETLTHGGATVIIPHITTVPVTAVHTVTKTITSGATTTTTVVTVTDTTSVPVPVTTTVTNTSTKAPITTTTTTSVVITATETSTETEPTTKTKTITTTTSKPPVTTTTEVTVTETETDTHTTESTSTKTVTTTKTKPHVTKTTDTTVTETETETEPITKTQTKTVTTTKPPVTKTTETVHTVTETDTKTTEVQTTKTVVITSTKTSPPKTTEVTETVTITEPPVTSTSTVVITGVASCVPATIINTATVSSFVLPDIETYCPPDRRG